MTDDELKGLFEALRQETRSDFRETTEKVAAETRYQLDIAIEHFDKRFDVLAESITNVDEKLERKSAALEERMERGLPIRRR